MAKKKVAKSAPKKVAKATPKKKVEKKSVNKSQLIREYATKHPNAGPTEIARELTNQGIKITPPLVSNVLGAAKKKKGGKRKKVGRPAEVVSDKVSLGALVSANQFVEKVGGVDEARALIKAIEKLG